VKKTTEARRRWLTRGSHPAQASGPSLPSTTCVIFTVPEKRLTAMDVSTGPCVAVGGRKHALTSVHQQQGPERPEQMAALFTVLTGKDSKGALELLEETESGQLYRCSPSFFDALVEADQTLARLARDEPDLFHVRHEELAHKWLQMGGWHPDMVGTQNRLFRIGTVRQAAAKGQSLYCWYGPPVPEYVLASGSSEELDAYLSTKRRPRG
jgi:hypothetical protein